MADSSGQGAGSDESTDKRDASPLPSAPAFIPKSEDRRQDELSEIRLARKRQIQALEALEEGVKIQRLILEEIQGLRNDLKQSFEK